MPWITEELIRKRCEHNEREIGTLEEISLHQEDIEKLEHLQNWCKDLKILLLHSNLISKIENLGKLKKLEYVNFSLNNIEKVENLEGCESLEKVDFTLNFIGELTSVDSLKANIHLHTLYLSGNPCTDYEGYREYVVATLPQLKYLDGDEITYTERIVALQKYEALKEKIIVQQKEYKEKRGKQKLEKQKLSQEMNDDKPMTQEEAEKYWATECDNSPETRIEMAKKSRKIKENEERKMEDPFAPPRRIVKLFDKSGRPLNVNEAKVSFSLDDDEENNCYKLDLHIYKYLDTNLLEVDVQPWYVKVMIKRKAFQLILQEEVLPDSSMAQRSQTTGHLVITLAKAKGEVKLKQKPISKLIPKEEKNKTQKKGKSEGGYLELGTGDQSMDYRRICEMGQTCNNKKEEFIDDPDVPPLEDLPEE